VDIDFIRLLNYRLVANMQLLHCLWNKRRNWPSL